MAPCKFAAKIASDLDKPDGLVVVPEDVAAFLAPLPIERMWGMGPKTAPRLRAAGFATIGNLAAAGAGTLEALLGEAGAAHTRPLALGLDPREVDPARAALSIGAEETFEQDIQERRALELRLLDLASRVARRLIRSGLVTRSITLKVKYGDFRLRTRSVRLPEPVADAVSIHDAVKVLLDRVLPGPVRLLGISTAELSPTPTGAAPALFVGEDIDRRRRLEAVVLAVGESLRRPGPRAFRAAGGRPAADPRTTRSPYEAKPRGR